jgi:hypothetical protein
VLRKLTTLGLAPTTTTLADTRYQWDAQDRLMQVTEDAHTASPKVTKQIYNGFDERIAEIIPGTGNDASRTKTYTLDHSFGNAQVVEERRANSIIAHHTLMPFQNAQGVMRISEVRGDGTGSQQGVIVNPAWHRYITDQQSTMRALIDQNSALTDQISFLPFGEVQRRTGTTATPFQYTGEQQAAGSLTYLRARFMDPLSLNKFNYVHSNPVMGVDPTGRFYGGGFGIAPIVTASVMLPRITATLAATNVILASVVLPSLAFRNPAYASTSVAGAIASRCAIAGSKPSLCNAMMPIIFLGDDFSQHRDFVSQAFFDASASPLLNWRDEPHDRDWLRNKNGNECGVGRTGGTTGDDCDEYPYASSVQGGQANYQMGYVKLKPVNSVQNQDAGRFLYRRLLKPCGLSRIGGSHPQPAFDGKSLYAVVPVPGLPTSVGRCANGQTYSGVQ